MDIKECHRVLELELGAPRDAVESAYCRLLERWHPDRVTPAGDPAAISKAARVVQDINEAYRTLIKIAPQASPSRIQTTASPSKSQATAPQSRIQTTAPAPPPAPSTSEPATPRAKPTLGAHTFTLPPSESQPTPRKPPSALPPLPAQNAPPLAPFAPTRPPDSPAPAPPPAATASEPEPSPPTTTLETPGAASATFTERLAKAVAMYDKLFPVGTPRRKFGLLILAGAFLFIFLVGKCAFSSVVHHRRARGPDPAKTGIVVVKSNRPDTVIELKRVPDAQDATTVDVSGNGPNSTLPGLPPGQYVLTAKSDGWPDIQRDVNVAMGRSIDVAVLFKSGSLRLDSDPTGATVLLAGTELGKTPLVIPQLPPGECALTLQYPSWPAVSLKTIITENVESKETVRLPYGKLTVESTPPGATVVLAGRVVGRTPVTLERVPAGIRKVILQSKNFPSLAVTVTVVDNGDVKVSPELALGFPEFDPSALLHAVWVPDDPNNIAPPFDLNGLYAPRNGVVKNLNRQRLYYNWLRKQYRYSGIVKSYDKENGKVELTEQTDELCRYRVLAELSRAARDDKDLIAQLIKGSTFSFYGRLDAAEEPRWMSKVITFEMSGAEPTH